MEARPVPALPPKPDLEPKSAQASFLWYLLVGFGALGLFSLLAFFATPVLWIVVGLSGIIGLQYLVWGWWFERIYRSNPAADDEVAVVPPPPQTEHRWPKPPDIV
jgi:hypothetical protein